MICRTRQAGRQRGQVLLLGVLIAGLGALVFVRYFSLGQMVAARSKQTHALDAAAYSGALVQARALNMLAFLNRSQVGHQVALAHLVTLGTWATLGGTEAQQFAIGNPPAYLIGMLFGPRHGQAYSMAAQATGFAQMASAQGDLYLAYQRHDSLVHDVLQSVQHALFRSVPEARMAAMQEVLAANYRSTASTFAAASGVTGGAVGNGSDSESKDSGARLFLPTERSETGWLPEGFDLFIEEDNWPAHIQYFSGASIAPFVRQLAGLYRFLDDRNYTASNPWPVDERCPALRHQLRRRGSTRLGDEGVWQSIDTQSFHALRSNRWIGCYYREYPMGWGWIPGSRYQQETAPYIENPPDNFSAQDFWRWVKEATNWDIVSGSANPLANSRAAALRLRWPGGGLPVYLDLDSPGALFRFRVRLRHPGPQGHTVSTSSAAETFFQRPEVRPDGKQENSNLFNPYWQARLAASGQALAESLVLVLVLLALWGGINRVGRLQDIALQTQHASRFLAFSLTRQPEARPLDFIRQHFFSGPDHQWRRPDGSRMLAAGVPEASLWVDQGPPVQALAQPAGTTKWAEGLRQEWGVADQGVLTAHVSLSSVNPELPVLERQTAILQGAGHGASDQQVVQRLDASQTAWLSAFRPAQEAGKRVTQVLEKVDSAWARAAPGFDWFARWSGYLPERHLSTGVQP